MALVSCGGVDIRAKPPTTASELQRQAAVQVMVSCLNMETLGVDQWRGSGVITGRHTILTANHVADCASGISAIFVETVDGDVYEALVKVQAEDHDIAKIVTEEELPGYAFKFGPRPEVGDLVCSESASPIRSRKCGKVSGVLEKPSNVDLKIGVHVVQGNSGSGLFNSRDELVGIVTACWAVDGVCSGTGAAASLWELEQYRRPMMHTY